MRVRILAACVAIVPFLSGCGSLTPGLLYGDLFVPTIACAGVPFGPLVPTVVGSINGTLPNGVVFSVSPPLPAGLSIDTATGWISGTPAAAHAVATYAVTAALAGAPDHSEGTLSLVVVDHAPSGLAYPPGPFLLPPGEALFLEPVTSLIGIASDFSITPPLPEGLSLSAHSGVIHGVPSHPVGPSRFTVTASNCMGSTQTTIELEVEALPVAAQPVSGLFLGIATPGGLSSFKLYDGGASVAGNGCLPTNAAVSAIVATPSGTQLYATSAGFLQRYGIDPLSARPVLEDPQAAFTGQGASAGVVTPAGDKLLLKFFTNFTLYARAPNGALSSPQTLDVIANVLDIVVLPNGRFAIAALRQSPTPGLLILSLQPTLATHEFVSLPGSDVTAIALAPSGSSLYVFNAAATSGECIRHYTVGPPEAPHLTYLPNPALPQAPSGGFMDLVMLGGERLIASSPDVGVADRKLYNFDVVDAPGTLQPAADFETPSVGGKLLASAGDRLVFAIDSSVGEVRAHRVALSGAMLESHLAIHAACITQCAALVLGPAVVPDSTGLWCAADKPGSGVGIQAATLAPGLPALLEPFLGAQGGTASEPRIAVNPSMPRVYVGARGSDQILAFSYAPPSARLTPMPAGGVTGPTDLVELLAAPSGQFVYGVGDFGIFTFRVDAATGALLQFTSISVSLDVASAALFEPSGRALLVLGEASAVSGNLEWRRYRIDPSGQPIQQAAGTFADLGPTDVRRAEYAPSGRFLMISTGGALRRYAVSPAGNPAPAFAQQMLFDSMTVLDDFAISPSGRVAALSWGGSVAGLELKEPDGVFGDSAAHSGLMPLSRCGFSADGVRAFGATQFSFSGVFELTPFDEITEHSVLVGAPYLVPALDGHPRLAFDRRWIAAP